MQVMNIYRILESTASGILKSRVQYDRYNGEVKMSRQYRDELLNQLVDEIKIARNKNIKDIIIAGDFNQDIKEDQIKRFMRENGLFEVHKTLNEIEDMVKDRMQEKGSKQIDAVLAIEDVLRTIQGSILVDFKDIVDTDHRGFIFDIDVKEYFSVDTSEYDKRDNIILDLTRYSH